MIDALSLILEARGPLLRGTMTTIQVFVLSLIAVCIVSFVVGLARVSRNKKISWLAIAYIEFFRGVSLLVQLFWLFFVLPLMGISLQPLTTAVIGFGACLGAYGAEIVRGGIQSVRKGQIDAAQALNYSQIQMMWRVIIPQSIPIMLPPFANLAIELLKATSLVSLVTIQDLAFSGYTLTLTTMQVGMVMTTVLMIYFILAQVISWSFRWLERKASVGMVHDRPL